MYEKGEIIMLVKPFGGLEAKGSEVERINCPPYDVVTLEEAKEFAKDPHSFMRIVRSDSIAKKDEDIYEVAAKELKRFVDEGILIKNQKPVFYIYSQKMGNHIQKGLIATVSSDEYPQKIKRHELTRKEKEDERLKHILATRAHTGQVFLMYRAKNEIKQIINAGMTKLIYDVKTKNPDVQHKIYRIDDGKLIDEIISAFDGVNAFYIADGHHRAAASVRASKEIGGKGEWNYFMATIFPHDELQIMGYHRSIKTLGSMDKDTFIRKMKSNNFSVKCTYDEVPKTAFHKIGMYIGGEWYEIVPLDANDSDPIERLDVQILQKRVFEPILGINDPRVDPNLSFLGGIHGPEELKKDVDSKNNAIAFLMNPTRVEDVMDVADADLIMPPKSTWFEPKLRSGFVLHTF
jgi:uncharacterized protein (DUF1015 family)|uniref:DUF1015 domain-containing protein n=1 Tax=Mesoaciditoga lauensis TaxID=1495039 RepID=A0A7V3RDJ5_9BACT